MRKWTPLLSLTLSVFLGVFVFGCGSSHDSPGDGGGVGILDAVGPGSPGASDGGDGGLIHIDRAHLADAGTSGTLDYSDPALWVCRPGIDDNPCYGNLDATELLPDGGRQLVKHQRAESPKFDCFYVYPTVDLTENGNMTNLSSVKLVLDPLLSQAAPFTKLCEVYAPLYRQVAFTPSSIGTTAADAGAGTDASTGPDATAGGDGGAGGDSSAGGDAASVGAAGGDAGSGASTGPQAVSPQAVLAFGDVRAAFKYYLDHFNHGRKFVILGHSQGTQMMMAVMQMDVDPVPQVRSQMISALLIGGNATVAPGQAVNGTFKNIPTCAKPGDTGCMIAYSSFDVDSPPGANALFGRSATGNQVACTNPGLLAGNSGLYSGTYFPTTSNNPAFIPDNPPPADAGTPFVLYRNMFQGNCVMKSGASYLEVALMEQPGDPRGIPPYKNAPSEALGFGLHIVDYNIPLEDLVNAVAQQAAAAVP